MTLHDEDELVRLYADWLRTLDDNELLTETREHTGLDVPEFDDAGMSTTAKSLAILAEWSKRGVS
jgi:hypothetical protein